MIKYLLILSFCLFIDYLSFSQQATQNQSKVAFQVDSLNKTAEKLTRSAPDSALSIIQKSKKLAVSNSYKLGEGIALMHQSYATSFKGNYKEALDMIENAISILENTSNKSDLGFAYNQRGYLKERLGDIEEALQNYTKAVDFISLSANSESTTHLCIVYNNLGGYYQRRGDYIQSLAYFNKTLYLSEKQDDQTLTAICLSNIGNIHFFQKEFEKAIPYYKKSIEIRKKLGDEKGLAQVYNNLGGTLLSQLKTQEALPYLDEAAQLYKQVGNTRGYLMSQTNIGLIYYQEKNYSKAIQYFELCLELEKEITDKNTLAMIYNNLAAANNQLKNYDKGIIYAEKGLEVAQKIQSNKTIGDNLASLALAYAGNKEYEKAYQYHIKLKQHQDSIFNLEKSSELNALLLEQKTSENTKLEQENKLKAISLEKETLQRKTKEQAFNLLEKQAEADRLLALAQNAKNKQEADSLYRAAQNAQLEADNLKIKAEKTEAEKRATEAESKQKIAFQRNISTVFGIGILAALLIAYIAYRNQKNKQKANLLLAEKNEEINLQNELLEDSNQTKDRLFSIIAHDLRSPMMAFQDVSRQLEFYIQKQDSEKLLKTVKLLDTSATNLTNLLNNLLHWSLLQQKQQIRYQFDTYSLSLLLSEIITTYQTISDPKQIEWQITIPTELNVFVDAPSFQTIIRNIISNAIKFTPIKGKITIQAIQKNDELIQLSIQDTGAGIPLEVQKNLSQNTLNPTQKGTKNEKGTGLGLLLCYQFAKENNIIINLESQEQKGTLFTFLIPTQKKQ